MKKAFSLFEMLLVLRIIWTLIWLLTGLTKSYENRSFSFLRENIFMNIQSLKNANIIWFNYIQSISEKQADWTVKLSNWLTRTNESEQPYYHWIVFTTNQTLNDKYYLTQYFQEKQNPLGNSSLDKMVFKPYPTDTWTQIMRKWTNFFVKDLSFWNWKRIHLNKILNNRNWNCKTDSSSYSAILLRFAPDELEPMFCSFQSNWWCFRLSSQAKDLNSSNIWYYGEYDYNSFYVPETKLKLCFSTTKNGIDIWNGIDREVVLDLKTIFLDQQYRTINSN